MKTLMMQTRINIDITYITGSHYKSVMNLQGKSQDKPTYKRDLGRITKNCGIAVKWCSNKKAKTNNKQTMFKEWADVVINSGTSTES